MAAVGGQVVWWRALLALAVSLALQVGVNYANDYSDGVRGTDSDRVGPLRLVGSGLVTAKRVKFASFAAFGVAAVCGLALAAVTTWWLLLVGVAAITAAWFYTGGSHPYGYMGLGEVFVFVFFGLVATTGTTFVQVGRMSWPDVMAGSAVGALSCAMLVTNNLRDLPKDAMACKRTLAVRMGDGPTRWFYVSLCLLAPVLAAALVPLLGSAWPAVAMLAIPAAVTPLRAVLGQAKGRDLIAVLGGTGRYQLVFALLLTAGLFASAVTTGR